MSLGLASLTEKGVQPRTSHQKLYRLYVTAVSPTGRQEEKKAPMFGIWQVSGIEFSIFSSFWSAGDHYLAAGAPLMTSG